MLDARYLPWLMVGAVVLIAGAYVKTKGVVQTGAAIGGAAVDAGVGVILGIGDKVGVPRTNEDECAKAIREGRTWDASFACPAGTWIKSLFSSNTAATCVGCSTQPAAQYQKAVTEMNAAESASYGYFGTVGA